LLRSWVLKVCIINTVLMPRKSLTETCCSAAECVKLNFLLEALGLQQREENQINKT